MVEAVLGVVFRSVAFSGACQTWNIAGCALLPPPKFPPKTPVCCSYMPFYVIRNSSTGLYLPLLGSTWVADLRYAAVFSMRGTAVNAIRRAWRTSCVVERITRLPDRIPRQRR